MYGSLCIILPNNYIDSLSLSHSAKHYEMSSFAEKKAMKFCREACDEFINYNKRQLSRIYPAGARIDSSNYDPIALWNCGSQLGE